MKAMILAAGFGTRLKPFTDIHPKALALVNGKSLLQRNIEYLAAFGIKNIIVNVHHFADQIQETIEINNGWGSNITISDEADAILETGGGMKRAVWFFKKEETFILINVDVLTDMPLNEMIAYHNINNPLATLATLNRKTLRYFLFDDKDELCGWRNVKTGEEKICKTSNVYYQKAFSGIHIINHEIFSLMKQQGKFSIIDVYLSLCDNYIIKSFDHSNRKFIDVGKPESIAIAESMFE